MESGCQIDRNDRVPFFRRELVHGRNELDPGIVHQHIDAAKGFGCLVNQDPALATIRHVCLYIGDANAVLFGYFSWQAHGLRAGR